MFFFPIVLGSLFQQIYAIADTIIVGRFVGKTALAAVGGSASRIVDLLVGFFVGLSSGASVILAQYFGAQKKKRSYLTIHTAIAFSILSGLFVTVVGIILTKPLLQLLSTPIDTMSGACTYLTIYFLGTIFNLLYNMAAALLRAMGDSKRPLYVLIMTCLVNIILDIIFVVVFRLQIAGVAIATILCQSISAFLVLYMLYKSENCDFHLKEIKIHLDYLKKILKIGIPAALESLTYSITNSFIQIYINILGTSVIAAWSVAGKVDSFFWMFLNAFSIAITTFVAQNYGAGKIDRVRKSIKVCLMMTYISSIIIVAIILTNIYPIYQLFTTDVEVMKYGIQIEYYLMPTYLIFIIISILSGALRGVGKVIIPLLLSCGGVCLIRIIWLLLVFPQSSTLKTVMFSYPLSYVITAILFIIYYYKKFPKQQELA
ncbi:MAG: MATE family efflux transporter [Faecalibacillus sp.]